jgi:hypothetical protein
MLRENFLISERVKQNSYKMTFAKPYFWRTRQQQEIDYVEQQGLKMSAYELKWNPRAKSKFSKTFLKAYDAKTKIINKDNFRDFVILK